MSVITYNDQLRNLLSNIDCVLAFDTAADFLGLTNGGYRPMAQIFVSKKQDISGTEQIIVPSLETLEYEEHNGLLCTTVNQTIIDLLEQNGDEQIITESLANIMRIMMRVLRDSGFQNICCRDLKSIKSGQLRITKSR